MRTRTSYDTAIKHLYRKGLEDVLPMSLRKKIPRNNIHCPRVAEALAEAHGGMRKKINTKVVI